LTSLIEMDTTSTRFTSNWKIGMNPLRQKEFSKLTTTIEQHPSPDLEGWPEETQHMLINFSVPDIGKKTPDPMIFDWYGDAAYFKQPGVIEEIFDEAADMAQDGNMTLQELAAISDIDPQNIELYHHKCGVMLKRFVHFFGEGLTQRIIYA